MYKINNSNKKMLFTHKSKIFNDKSKLWKLKSKITNKLQILKITRKLKNVQTILTLDYRTRLKNNKTNF